MSRLLEETTVLLPMQNGGKAVVRCESVLRLQDAKTDPLSREDERRKMAEWLNGYCTNTETHPHYGRRSRCDKCMVELKALLSEGRAPWDSPGHATEAGAGGSALETHICYYCSYEGTDVNRIAVPTDHPNCPPGGPLYCCDDGESCNARIALLSD